MGRRDRAADAAAGSERPRRCECVCWYGEAHHGVWRSRSLSERTSELTAAVRKERRWRSARVPQKTQDASERGGSESPERERGWPLEGRDRAGDAGGVEVGERERGERPGNPRRENQARDKDAPVVPHALADLKSLPALQVTPHFLCTCPVPNLCRFPDWGSVAVQDAPAQCRTTPKVVILIVSSSHTTDASGSELEAVARDGPVPWTPHPQSGQVRRGLVLCGFRIRNDADLRVGSDNRSILG